MAFPVLRSPCGNFYKAFRKFYKHCGIFCKHCGKTLSRVVNFATVPKDEKRRNKTKTMQPDGAAPLIILL